jgi:hypothetical protein
VATAPKKPKRRRVCRFECRLSEKERKSLRVLASIDGLTDSKWFQRQIRFAFNAHLAREGKDDG